MRTIIALSLALSVGGLSASTIAYWRFEGDAGGGWIGTIGADASGNGNILAPHPDIRGGGHGTAHMADVPSATIPVSGSVNKTSIRFSLGNDTNLVNDTLQSWEPLEWTVEFYVNAVSFAGEQAVLSRGSRGHGIDAATKDFATLQMRVNRPASAGADSTFRVAFTDVAGYRHVIDSPALITHGDWHHIAAVSDGSLLSLYINGTLAGTKVLGTADTRLAAGEGSGTGWHAGDFLVGASVYQGNKNDYARGTSLVDEIRFSDKALSPEEFLIKVPEPGSVALAGLGALMFLRRRR